MAHPYDEHKAHKHEKSRVGHITRGYATGGGVKHSDEAQDEKLIKKMVRANSLKEEGGKSKKRGDRPHRAKGGRVHKSKGKSGSKTAVNVIVAPSGGAKAPMGMPPGAGLPPPPKPMLPPPGAGALPPGGPPPGAGGPPGMPPGMPPMRAKGGKVQAQYQKAIRDEGKDLKAGMARKKGGRVPHDAQDVKRADWSGPLEDNGEASKHRKRGGSCKAGGGPVGDGSKIPLPRSRPIGREVQPSDLYDSGQVAKLNKQYSGKAPGDEQENGRYHGGRTVAEEEGRKKGGRVNKLWGDAQAFKRGGKVSAAEVRGLTGIGKRTPIQHTDNKQDAPNIGRKPVITRATGGPIYSDGRDGHDMGPQFEGGSAGGKGRLAKAARYSNRHN